MTDLKNLRADIDAIDNQIADLLNKRLQVVSHIRDVKTSAAAAIRQPAREAEILQRLARQNPSLSPSLLKGVWRQIFEDSVRFQNNKATNSPYPVPNSGISQIAPYIGGEAKADGAARLIRLASNENPYGCSDEARSAYINLASELHRYPDGGSHALRNAIAEVHNLPAGQIVCGAGSDELIALLTKAYAGVGDEILYSQYGFLMYPIASKAVGATPVMAPETNLKADISTLLNHITPATKIILLANPNNPTGSYLTRSEIEELAAKLPKHIVLVIDAAYAEYVTAKDYAIGYELVKQYPNIAILQTFSKIYGLASLRLGWCYASPGIIDTLNRVRGPFNVSLPAQAAGIAAVKDQDFIQRAVSENSRIRTRFAEQVQSLDLTPHPSETNFILIDFGNAERAEQTRLFLKENGILVRQMPAYNLPNCLRITIGTESDMDEVISCLQKALSSFK